ncbi:pyrimidine 5'-nucleotidase [Oceanisphaera avium]|uniref:Noncanonical pyrimidine nucleotidase, YjjG family n=1 Tax=Oceanisphaera avium TaxID=1903694 RepID=A0A1Y0CZ49_9GAMM|nr:pyrimidine 5'-nucleotidase [Oceanisphaera avium]ART80600.1 noncanonical pyrimidine nucleotidase, YjjG family [Oceanisphaera avium]
MRYSWILFDADETLFHFDAFAGLKVLFASFGIDFTAEDYRQYHTLSAPLWVDYQNGAISAAQLQHLRFANWAERLQVSTDTLNRDYLAAMAEVSPPLSGAPELISALQGKAKLGIITNGFSAMQHTRLAKAGWQQAFDTLVISEQVGIAKPAAGIFEHAFALMGHPPKEQILMVGDNPHSDILGGLNAGIDTCWLNSTGRSTPQGIRPHYEVNSLQQLQRLLLG